MGYSVKNKDNFNNLSDGIAGMSEIVLVEFYSNCLLDG